MKTCTKCLTDKPESEFYETGRVRADGTKYRLPSCKGCYAAYYAANRERQLKTNQRARIKLRYGLTVEEYDALIARGCSICGETEKRIVMDHCHATNAVRAPLCDQCNQMLGNARDDPGILLAGMSYLAAHAPVE